MIKARLKQWGYLKNAKKEDWHFLALLHYSRKDQGKSSTAFDVRGHRKTVKDLQRFIRNQGMTTDQFLLEARQTAGDKKIPDYIQALSSDQEHCQDAVIDDVSPDHLTPSPLQPSAGLDAQQHLPRQSQFLHPMSGAPPSRARSISASSNEHESSSLSVFGPQRTLTIDMQDSASSSASACTQLQWEFETCAAQIVNPAPLKSRLGHEDIHTWALLSHSPGASDKSSGSSVSTEFVCSRCNQPSQLHFISLDNFEPRQAAPARRDILNGDDQPLHLPVSTKEEGSWTWVSRCFLACMCLSKGDHEAAEQCLRQAAIEFERLLEKKDRLLLTAAGLVMTIMHMHDQGDIARRVIGSANEVARRSLPAEHPVVVTMQYLTAAANISQREAGIDSRALKTVWHNFSLFYEPTHEYIIAARYNYAWMLKFENRFAEAEMEARAVYDVSCRVLGKLHMQSITCLAVIAGCIYTNRSRLTECIAIFESVIEDAKSCLGAHHPYTLEAKRRLADKISEQDGPCQRTLELYKDVLWGRVQMLGPGHQFTIAARKSYEDELKTLNLWTCANNEPTRQRRGVESLFANRSPELRSWTKIDRRRSPNRLATIEGLGIEFEDDDMIDDDDDDNELVVIRERLGGSESPRSTVGGFGAY